MEKSKKTSHSSSLLQLWYSFFQGPFLALNFCDVWSASKIPNKNPFIFLSLQKITTHCFIIDPTTTSRVSFSHKISQRTHMSGEKAKIKIIPQKPIKKALLPGLLSAEAEKAASLAIRPLINWQQTCLIIFPSAFFFALDALCQPGSECFDATLEMPQQSIAFLFFTLEDISVLEQIVK